MQSCSEEKRTHPSETVYVEDKASPWFVQFHLHKCHGKKCLCYSFIKTLHNMSVILYGFPEQIFWPKCIYSVSEEMFLFLVH